MKSARLSRVYVLGHKGNMSSSSTFDSRANKSFQLVDLMEVEWKKVFFFSSLLVLMYFGMRACGVASSNALRLRVRDHRD